jgi:hypothetical protein
MVRKIEDYKNLACPLNPGDKNLCRADRCALWEDYGFVDDQGYAYCGKGVARRAGWCGLIPKRTKTA